MPTTDEIFNEFLLIIEEIDNEGLRNKLSKLVLSSVDKHREYEDTINQLKKNMEAQTQQFIDNLEKLEHKKCPLAKSGNHH